MEVRIMSESPANYFPLRHDVFGVVVPVEINGTPRNVKVRREAFHLGGYDNTHNDADRKALVLRHATTLEAKVRDAIEAGQDQSSLDIIA